MASAFLTKKQKAQMKERRRKKMAALKESGADIDTFALTNKKRKRQQEQSEAPQPQIVTIPKGKSTKDAKKIRKEARRRARRDGLEESLVTFVVEGQEEEAAAELGQAKKKKKPKKTFPRINDLIKQEKEQEEQQKQEEARIKAEENLPPDVKAHYVACDCEMVGIGTDGKQSALARVSLVDWHGAVMLDTFVQVPSRVTDFRTHVSGVTAKHIQKRHDAMEVTKCRELVAQHLKDKILVGHALKNDLQALMLQHPKHHIRDTAKYRPFQRLGGTKWRPRKLRDLVKEHLGKSIQVEGESHDSVQDAASTMELFKRVRDEWEKELEAKEKRKSKRKKK